MTSAGALSGMAGGRGHQLSHEDLLHGVQLVVMHAEDNARFAGHCCEDLAA